MHLQHICVIHEKKGKSSEKKGRNLGVLGDVNELKSDPEFSLHCVSPLPPSELGHTEQQMVNGFNGF